MYLTFKVWMTNVPTHNQFVCTTLFFQHLNEDYFIVKIKIKLIEKMNLTITINVEFKGEFFFVNIYYALSLQIKLNS